MKLNQNDIFLLSQCAISAAYQAGHMISAQNINNLDIKSKSGGESLASQVLTEVDLKSQEIILKNILPTIDIYDLGLLAEESIDNKTRFKKDYFWCIDPLDGTLPFTEGTTGYSVSIALVDKNGSPVIGVIYDPVDNNLYHAVKGKGAFKNHSKLNIKNTQSKTFTLVFDRSFLKHKLYNEIYDYIQSIALSNGYEKVKSISHGGAAMNAIWVLENPPACYFKFPKKEDGGGSLWDYSASACIFAESGGLAVDIYGKPLQLNRSGSTFMNQEGIFYSTNDPVSKLIQEGVVSKFL